MKKKLTKMSGELLVIRGDAGVDVLRIKTPDLRWIHTSRSASACCATPDFCKILHRSQSKRRAKIPALTWRRTSCGQASEPSSCKASEASFCSSTPGGISLFQDTRTPRTSSSVWPNLRCLDPGFWTLPGSRGPGGGGKEKMIHTGKNNYIFF